MGVLFFLWDFARRLRGAEFVGYWRVVDKISANEIPIYTSTPFMLPLLKFQLNAMKRRVGIKDFFKESPGS